MAALEGGFPGGAVATSSGQSATLLVVLALSKSGDNWVSDGGELGESLAHLLAHRLCPTNCTAALGSNSNLSSLGWASRPNSSTLLIPLNSRRPLMRTVST